MAMTISTEQIAKFKNKLEEELKLLEEELSSVGRRNPSNEADWEAKPNDTEPESDPNEMADHIEDYETNTGIVKELEIRYNNVRRALDKIEKGTYGKCEITDEDIELARLEANPSARTCKDHLDAELN